MTTIHEDVPADQRSRWRLIAASVLAITAALVQLPLFDRSIVPMDEGHLAAVASWLQQGKYLYRDLHTGIFPGIYHLTALLFATFGNDLVVARWAEVATNVALTLCLFLCGVRVMRPAFAVVAPLLYLALIPLAFPVLTMFNYSTLSLAFCMGALLFLLRFFDTGSRTDAAALGILLALAVLTKQNFGALAFVACHVALVIGRKGSAIEDRSLFATLLPVATAGTLVTLVFVAYFLATGTFADFWTSTVVQLRGDQLQSFNNPIPPIFGPHPTGDSRFVFLYTPPSVFNTMLHQETLLGSRVTDSVNSIAIRLSYGVPLLVLGLGLLLALLRLRHAPNERRQVVLPAFFAAVFFLGIFPSAIWSHLAFILAPILLVAGVGLDRLDRLLACRNNPLMWPLRFAVGGMVLALSVGGLRLTADIARWHPVPMQLPHASLRVSEGQAEVYRNAMRFVDQCAPGDQSFFVAPDMPVLYFIAQRANPTRYDLTIPGDVDGRLIIVGLEQNRTRCIVYNPVMYAEFPPFRDLFPELHRYIGRNYREQMPIVGGGSRWQGLVRKTPFSGRFDARPQAPRDPSADPDG